LLLDVHDLTFDDAAITEEQLLNIICTSSETVTHANALVVLASLYSTQGRHSEAIEAAESALRIAPTSPLQAYVLAELSWRIFGDEEPINDLVSIVRANEVPRGYLAHLADCLEGELAFTRGDFKLAAEKLLESMNYDGKNVIQRRGSLRLVRILVERGVERDACRTFLHASLERCCDARPQLVDLLAEPVRTLLARL
jgi:hypothetical protein